METGAILAIAAGALVVLGGVFAYVTTRARDRQAAVGALSHIDQWPAPVEDHTPR